MKTIDIIVPTFNEEENVNYIYEEVKEIMEANFPKYGFTLTFIDNNSQDLTRTIIKNIAKEDKRVRAIFNAKNFGHIRSPYYALSHSDGDCAILMSADFQDPPEKIVDFIKKWEEGYKVVYGVKRKSNENPIMCFFRAFYYKLMKRISEVDHISNFTGFGLYDSSFIRVLNQLDDPYPYMRGLVAELGFKVYEAEFIQPKRKNGKTKNNLYTLYDMAILGITSYTKLLMRLAIFLALTIACVSFICMVGFVIADMFGAKITSFQYTMALVFLVLSIILFFIGLQSEYVMMANQRLLKRPLVIEEERINFTAFQSQQENEAQSKPVKNKKSVSGNQKVGSKAQVDKAKNTSGKTKTIKKNHR